MRKPVYLAFFLSLYVFAGCSKFDEQNPVGAAYVEEFELFQKAIDSVAIGNSLLNVCSTKREERDFTSNAARLILGSWNGAKARIFLRFRFGENYIDSLSRATAAKLVLSQEYEMEASTGLLQANVVGAEWNNLEDSPVISTTPAHISDPSLVHESLDTILVYDTTIVDSVPGCILNCRPETTITCIDTLVPDSSYLIWDLNLAPFTSLVEAGQDTSDSSTFSLAIDFDTTAQPFIKRFLTTRAGSSAKPRIVLTLGERGDSVYASEATFVVSASPAQGTQVFSLAGDKAVFEINPALLSDSLPDSAVVANASLTFHVVAGSHDSEAPPDSIICRGGFTADSDSLFDVLSKAVVHESDEDSSFHMNVTGIIQEFGLKRQNNEGRPFYFVLEYLPGFHAFAWFKFESRLELSLVYSHK